MKKEVPAPRSSPQLEGIEIQLLLEGIYLHYGYDFRDYAPASLRRRVREFASSESLPNVSALQERILHDRSCFDRFLVALTVNVSSMFRDPGFYLLFRRRVVPLLKTYPFIRIWDAGCSTGEEVYSLAILLSEEGLYDRCRIYATDMNETVLEKAKLGIYPLTLMKEYVNNYMKAGGTTAFSEYYMANYDHAIFRAWLRDNVVFSRHNLVTDTSFNEFNVILCRNVLIYFAQSLQNRVHDLIYNSLGMFGVLGLGQGESLKLTPHESHYEALSGREKLFRRIK